MAGGTLTVSFTLSVVIVLLARPCESFTPTRNMQLLTELIDLDLTEKPIAATLTHMDIMRLGVVRSITRYFALKQRSYASDPAKHLVRLDKSDSVYAEKLAELYKDFMGAQEYASISECGLRVERILKELGTAVADVDFDKQLKNLPWAHFDANTFVESNRHVRKLISEMYADIELNNNMVRARAKLGSLMHTIHDFYSHSNWIEMGNTDRINTGLGSEEFESNYTEWRLNNNNKTIDGDLCFTSRCEKKILKCNHLRGLTNLIKHLSMNLPLTCPVVYYVCKDNVRTDRLTSGYFTGQRLENGDEVRKPAAANVSMCSHGGAFDASSQQPAEGGINKDTGYYFLSPRADLHQTAARLAVGHTEWFMNEVRARVGDEKYEELLQLFHTETPSVLCYFHRFFAYV